MNNAQQSTPQKTAITPFLSVRKGVQAIEFYKSAFGAAELFRVESDTQEVVAQLSIDGAEFWVSDESPQYLNFSPQTLGGGTVRILLTVENPDAVFARAVFAGAKEISPVTDQHGWRFGRVVDPYGHHWEIGKPLPKEH